METSSVVSLWIGEAESERQLDDYLDPTHTEDGEMIPSAFMNDFGLDSWTPMCRESQFLESWAAPAAELLAGHSYDDQAVPQLAPLLSTARQRLVNAIVLLYDYHYSGSTVRDTAGAVRLTFVGTATYEHRS